MDLWGHCEACTRWFYMPAPAGDCPVCQRPPSSIVDRDESSPAATSQAS